MASYYKYFDELMEKFVGLGQKSESIGGDWKDNILKLFKNAKRYHFDCKLGERDEVYFHYYASKNENNLVSFTLFRKNRKFKCNSAFGFPYEYSEEKKNGVMYEICRDCIGDLEHLEKLMNS